MIGDMQNKADRKRLAEAVVAFGGEHIQGCLDTSLPPHGFEFLAGVVRFGTKAFEAVDEAMEDVSCGPFPSVN